MALIRTFTIEAAIDLQGRIGTVGWKISDHSQSCIFNSVKSILQLQLKYNKKISIMILSNFSKHRTNNCVDVNIFIRFIMHKWTKEKNDSVKVNKIYSSQKQLGNLVVQIAQCTHPHPMKNPSQDD